MFQILAGDADGADKAVQRYLADRSYTKVLVHCMKDHCRNNVGNWPTREVAATRGAKASTVTPSRTARWRRLRSTSSTYHAITTSCRLRRANQGVSHD